MKLLMLSRDAGYHGGVVNMVATWRKYYSPFIEFSSFTIGARQDRRCWARRFIQPIVDACGLLCLLYRKRFDVVHINPSLNVKSLFRDGLFMVVCVVVRQPVLVFFHGWDESLSFKIRDTRVFSWLLRITYGKANVVLVLASSFREQLLEMGVSGEKVKLITTMFDGTQIKELSGAGEEPGQRILFLSRFVREKGLFELVDAFSRIAKEFPDARMVLAGEGPAMADLTQTIVKNGLSDVVELPGYLRDAQKTDALVNADIFVLPTYYGEGCPVSILEAMACGLAVIATPVGGIPDILQDGRNGVLLETSDPNQIYMALRKLLLSPELVVTMSKVNRTVAWHRYEAGVVTSIVEEYYQTIIRESQ